MSQGKPIWRRVLRTFLWLVGFGLLGRVLWANRGSVGVVLAHRPDGRILVLAFVLALSALVSTFVRWWIMARAQQLPLSLLDAVRIGFIGNAVDLVIPGQVGGDVLKASFLARGQERKIRAIASILIDRAVGILGLFLLASVMGAANWASSGIEVHRLVVIAWSALAAGALGLWAVLTPSIFRTIERSVSRPRRLRAMIGELHAVSTTYRDRKAGVALGLAMSTASHTLYALSFAAVSAALLPAPPSVLQHLAMVPLILFTTIVPLPFGALGLSEQVSDELFRMMGHPMGGLAMLGFRVLGLALTCVSITVYITNGRGLRQATVAPEVEFTEDSPPAISSAASTRAADPDGHPGL
jgi:uncharacterized protein (TIRG00374 family)